MSPGALEGHLPEVLLTGSQMGCFGSKAILHRARVELTTAGNYLGSEAAEKEGALRAGASEKALEAGASGRDQMDGQRQGRGSRKAHRRQGMLAQPHQPLQREILGAPTGLLCRVLGPWPG